jgi:Protein of unknown function (DUF3352)
VRAKLGVLAVTAIAFVAAGCGGGGGGGSAPSGGASIAPNTTVGYISANSNVDSAGWKKAEALLDRFPGKATLLAQFNDSLQKQGLDWSTDVKPALGDEIDVVWLDFRNNGQDAVGLTKPKDTAKFDALLEKSSTPAVHEQIEGWTVFASTQSLLDRFKTEHDQNGALADDSAFSDPYGGLPSDSLARMWLRGSAVQSAFDQRLQASGLPGDTTKDQFGSISAITGAFTPGSDGVRLETSFDGDVSVGGSGYHAELTGAVPAGAIAYVSFNGLGSTINKLIDSFGGSITNFDQERAQIELVLGYPLKDVFDLLSGEGALAVYNSSSGTPGVLFVAKVSDESKARKILDRLATLAAASGSLHMQTVQIGSAQADEITLSNGTHAYAAVFDGKLVTTNDRSLLEQMQGGGQTLADDSAFKAALSGANAPDQTNGFVYANINDALAFAFDYAQSHGSSIPQSVKDNTAPLQGLLLYGSKDGGNYKLTGFLGIQ